MWEEQEFIDLEKDERKITDDAIFLMLALLKRSHRRLEKELRDFYNEYGTDGVVTYAEARKWVSKDDHRRRLTALLLLITKEIQAVGHRISPQFRKMLEDVIKSEEGFFDTEVDTQKTVESHWGAEDQNWSMRLDNDVALWVMYIMSDIKQSLLRKNNLQGVLKQLDKRYKSMEFVVNRLALTESTAIGSFARLDIFKQLGVTKYQFFTKEDERTCPTCSSMHGLIFPISAYEVGVTASPVHVNCRCFEIPIFD